MLRHLLGIPATGHPLQPMLLWEFHLVDGNVKDSGLPGLVDDLPLADGWEDGSS
jgi:hypothetical protein